MALRDRQSRKSKKGKAGQPSAAVFVGAVAGFLSLVGFLVWGFVMSREGMVRTDSQTLCPVEVPPSEVVVLLVDVSDTPSAVQAIAIGNELDRAVSGVRPMGRLEVYSLAESADELPTSEFVICNPGDGADLNRLYQNPDLARQRWQDDFLGQLNPILKNKLSAPASPQSPIFEAIQSVAVGTFGAPSYDGVSKRLIIISDLIQYVPGVASHYQRVPDAEKFLESPYFNKVRSDLLKVAVEVIYIERTEVEHQGGKHIDFWNKYFDRQGARIVQVRRIFG